MRALVVSEDIFRETIRKENLTRIRWSTNWGWYLQRLRERQRDIDNYKKCSPKAAGLVGPEKEDPRTVRPFPVTTSRQYGWLSSRKEFTLEVFGPYYERVMVKEIPPDASSSLFQSISEYPCGPPLK